MFSSPQFHLFAQSLWTMILARVVHEIISKHLTDVAHGWGLALSLTAAELIRWKAPQ